jgi:hypothetical protein
MVQFDARPLDVSCISIIGEGGCDGGVPRPAANLEKRQPRADQERGDPQ